jgi:hypothetical protein
MSQNGISQHQSAPINSYHATIVCHMKHKHSKTWYITCSDTDDPTLHVVSVTSTSEVYVAVTLKC